MAKATSEHDPLHHTQKMKQRLSETVDHLRDDINQLKAMFEVLTNLKNVFSDDGSRLA